FIRLSNLSLGYTFNNIPGMENADVRIYVSGQNLFLITDYSGYDPEHTSRTPSPNDPNNADVSSGINTGAYPNPRTWTMGIKVGL
ncbi:MAG: hypothetical protein AAGA85_27725, partial [Bacteroidota bacterium]